MGYAATIHHVTGPYTNEAVGSKAYGRKIVCVYRMDGTHYMVSYPKFLVQYLLDRELDPTAETIDHLDGNVDNNSWENLRIVDKATHSCQDAKRSKQAQLTCVWCGTPFTRQASQVRHFSKSGKAGPFCSKKCSGSYAAEFQNGRADRLPVQPAQDSSYVRVDKVGGVLVSTLTNAKILSEHDILREIGERYRKLKAKEAAVPKVQRSIRTKKAERRCAQCGGIIASGNKKYCSQKCAHEVLKRVDRPTAEELCRLVWTVPTVKLAARFGVSDAAVAKWCREYGVEKPPRGYWAKKKAGSIQQIAGVAKLADARDSD
jgi:hypothetical protein